MNINHIPELDLSEPAANGLRRGRTTGTCATAAVKAALEFMYAGANPQAVLVTLPGGQYTVAVPIVSVRALGDGSVRADVVKDAGDDPDKTHGATIFAVVKPNRQNNIRFLAGAGVGIVSEPGISVPVGEPAINPGPRQMMTLAVEEVCGVDHVGFDLTIGCEGGAAIADCTFNSRLGIVGGISILGKSGIVEPRSCEAYKEALALSIRVALAEAPQAVAFRPGNIGIGFARAALDLPAKQVVHISNLIGFALESAESILKEGNYRLGSLWLLGHPGKIAKILDGVWETHSSNSEMAVGAVSRIAVDCGFDSTVVDRIAGCLTTEAITELLADHDGSMLLWSEIERRVGLIIAQKVSCIDRVAVRLFNMSGVALGAGRSEVAMKCAQGEG